METTKVQKFQKGKDTYVVSFNDFDDEIVIYEMYKINIAYNKKNINFSCQEECFCNYMYYKKKYRKTYKLNEEQYLDEEQCYHYQINNGIVDEINKFIFISKLECNICSQYKYLIGKNMIFECSYSNKYIDYFTDLFVNKKRLIIKNINHYGIVINNKMVINLESVIIEDYSYRKINLHNLSDEIEELTIDDFENIKCNFMRMPKKLKKLYINHFLKNKRNNKRLRKLLKNLPQNVKVYLYENITDQSNFPFSPVQQIYLYGYDKYYKIRKLENDKEKDKYINNKKKFKI